VWNDRPQRASLRLALASLLLLSVGAAELLARQLYRDPEAWRLYNDIVQDQDPALRQRRVDELLRSLDGRGDKGLALVTLIRVDQKQVPFDRGPFLDPVRRALGDSDEQVRELALNALPIVGAGEEDLKLIAKFANDPSFEVRAAVASSLFRTAKGKHNEFIWPIVEKLLDDPDERVRVRTVKSLWRNPVSPAIEQKLIEWSRPTGPEALRGETIYYALTTRPLISEAVARRLIEIMQEPEVGQDYRARAAAALGEQAVPQAQDLIVAGLILAIETSKDTSVRENAIEALRRHRTPAAQEKLRQLDQPGAR
jgi:HEAT repeat protein